ncbi:allergen Fel d 4-like isoform X2 [Manis pentadactyla]|uniref:allergen Fel d 4-like isoform X2 n=1 Tax=Manis pentadactyla TaxID=143292 RepID=UPI00255CE002|nr:allergen Fel d 4-like isoform X2 [Manis pentadactyla]
MDIKTGEPGRGAARRQRRTASDRWGDSAVPATMKLLLLCVGLTLVCAHEEGSSEVVRSNFDVQKISGNWYSILLASDAKENIEEDGSMRGFVEHIQTWDNSSLTFTFHIKVNGQCTEIVLLCDETEKSGVYSVAYDGHNLFHIVEAVYNKYIIFHLTNFNDGKPFQVMELYAREPDVSLELKKKFEKICQNFGIVKENIIDLTKIDRCLQARGSGEAQASSAE